MRRSLVLFAAATLVPPSFPAHPNELSYVHSAPVVARAIKEHLRR